jgi:hypothetical protein
VAREAGRPGENCGLRQSRGGVRDDSQIVIRLRVADHGLDAFAEAANGEFGRCASLLRRLSTGVGIEGDGVGHDVEGPGDFAEDNDDVQPCSGTGDAAIRSTGQVVSNDYHGDGHKCGTTIKPPGTRSIERKIGICFIAEGNQKTINLSNRSWIAFGIILIRSKSLY